MFECLLTAIFPDPNISFFIRTLQFGCTSSKGWQWSFFIQGNDHVELFWL